jgi:hypothetical protein
VDLFSIIICFFVVVVVVVLFVCLKCFIQKELYFARERKRIAYMNVCIIKLLFLFYEFLFFSFIHYYFYYIWFASFNFLLGWCTKVHATDLVVCLYLHSLESEAGAAPAMETPAFLLFPVKHIGEKKLKEEVFCFEKLWLQHDSKVVVY